jgi:hypothetical protein
MKETDSRKLRDYGLGDSTQHVRGVPIIKGKAEGLPACPNCGCETTFEIEVNVEHHLLRGNKGIGTYVGCAACPMATPMVMRATTPTMPTPDDPSL